MIWSKLGAVMAVVGTAALPAWAGEDQQVPAPTTFARVPAPSASVPRAAAAASTPQAPRRAAASTPPVVPRPLVPRPGAFAPGAALQATRSTAEQLEERAFVRQAAVRARFESEASQLATKRGHEPLVRAYAGELHRQQDAATAELLRLLHARGMAMPMMQTPQRKVLQRLARAEGPRFDREFLQAVAGRDQREKVQSYERAVGLVGDPAIRDWLHRQLPLVRQQMAAAEQLGAPVASQRGVTRAAAAASRAR